jgi:hypothetical protein
MLLPAEGVGIIKSAGGRTAQVIALAALIIVAGAVAGFSAGAGLFSTPTPSPTAVAQATTRPMASPLLTPAASATTSLPAAPAPSPTTGPPASPPATPPTLVAEDVPLVPVVSFWSGATSITRDRIASAITGNDPVYRKVVVPTGLGDAVDSAFGIARSGTIGGNGNPLEAEPDALANAIADGALGLVPLPSVTPTVRALAVDGVSLFGNGRVASIDQWPLKIELNLPPDSWDQAQTWTLVAGGDILLDRGVANEVTMLGKGVDFPWDGGTVEVTGHHCCTPFGWPVPETRRTGNAGIVRSLFDGADISLANLEGPVKQNATYHQHGLTFTGDPRLLDGVQDAGLDFLSLANNHIGNGGVRGLTDTIAALDARGIAHAGAGLNLSEAATPAYLSAGGQSVAVISCSQVGGFVAADDRAGDQRCSAPSVIAAITAARAVADVVIVFPHWGVEYRATPTSSQRALAAAWAAAGADLILGSHPHWAEAVSDIDGTFVFYCLGNLVFDQTWSESTMEGLIVELTFQGSRLVQAWLHPTFIMSAAQPNLLDYDGGGSALLARVHDASSGLFPY